MVAGGGPCHGLPTSSTATASRWSGSSSNLAPVAASTRSRPRVSKGVWAEIVAYEPPARIVLAWKPNDRPEPPTEVEIHFVPDGDGTIVSLEHRGWDKLGARAAEAREGHDGGWQLPLERFVAPRPPDRLETWRSSSCARRSRTSPAGTARSPIEGASVGEVLRDARAPAPEDRAGGSWTNTAACGAT